MSYKLQCLDDRVKIAESILGSKLGVDIKIEFYKFLDSELVESLVEIDHEKFRPELWYSQEDFLSRMNYNNFICIVAYISETPIAFIFGYDDEPTTYYIDEVASRIEGKGLGSALIILFLLYCIKFGYRFVSLYTEEQDEKNRKLRGFYEHLGFNYVHTDPKLGDLMRFELSENTLSRMYASNPIAMI